LSWHFITAVEPPGIEGGFIRLRRKVLETHMLQEVEPKLPCKNTRDEKVVDGLLGLITKGAARWMI